MSDPNDLCRRISHGSIFGLTTGARDSRLLLHTTGHKITPKEYQLPIGGAASLKEASPIDIRVANNLDSRRP